MSINHVDTIRHIKVFSADKFGDDRIDIIGLGATGSRIAISLAKLGVKNLHLWDFDKIEGHNIANQAFGMNHIGKFKCDALAEIIKEQTGLAATVHNEAVTGRTRLGKVVFLLTDTMASRKEIWEGAIRYKPLTDFMIETRMGKNEGRVYSVCPTSPEAIKFWEDNWYPDVEAQDSVCGSKISVGPTAELVSGIAVWQFISWFNATSIGGDNIAPSKELAFGTSPFFIVTQ